ncbi:MAG: esterase [Deltaproteobacteria bacterium]|nr:esterase [Deltaproteobacteria bacterium]
MHAWSGSKVRGGPRSIRDMDGPMSHPRLLLVMMLVGGCRFSGPTEASPGSPDGAIPPELTTVRVHYPVGSHTLALRGSAAGLDWSVGVPLGVGGEPDTFVYQATFTGHLEFKPLLDDLDWSRGPNYAVEGGATIDVYPHFFASKGAIVQLLPSFHSTLLGNDRVVWAYLPAGYDENRDARYPVLYMHDGQNLFDPTRAFGGNEWKVDETLDGASEDGSIRDLIVIGPENAGNSRTYEYTPTTDPGYPGGGGGGLYLRALVEELKPTVDTMLRTLPGRETTGVLGSSLGGLISADAGCTHADVFGIVGAMSPSTWWNNEVLVSEVQATGALRPLRVYVDSGDAGAEDNQDGVLQTNQLAATYLAIGYTDGVDFQHVVQMGAEHNEIYWAQRLPGALAFLFGPRTP